MKKSLRLLSLIICLSLMFTLLGCGHNDNSSAIIYYGVSEKPTSLDPQKASTISELMAVRNIYEGLLRINENGETDLGVAESYDKQGLTYTFHLRESVWSDKTNLTAYDFEFAFMRALDPNTNAPNASVLYSIKNAKAINTSGKSIQSLGVKAQDDRTLVIELERDDDDFLETLTNAICMPCNKAFFEQSKGKYGMTADTVLCNGSYKLTKWNIDDFAMRIAKNGTYSGNYTAKSSAVYFSMNTEKTNYEQLKSNSVDLTQIPASKIDAAEADGFGVFKAENVVWTLSLGNGYTDEMKRLIHSCIVNRWQTARAQYFTPAKTILPDFFQKNNIKEYATDDISVIKSSFDKEMKKNKHTAFPQTTLYYYNSDGTDISKSVAAAMQSVFGAYINISEVSNLNSLYIKTVNDEYGMSIYPTVITSSDISGYFSTFNVTHNSGDSIENLQNELFSKGNLFPIAFTDTVIAYANNLSGIKFDSTNGLIDFAYITKIL